LNSKINSDNSGFPNEYLLEALFRASRTTLNCIERILKEFNLCPTEFGVLEAITVLGPQPIQVIATRILITSGSMTYTVNQLIKKGFITRVCSKDDARRCYLHLTPKGNILIKKALKAHNDQVAISFAPLAEDEKKTLTRLLTTIYATK